MEGEQTVGSNTGDIDVDFDDVFDKLKTAFIFNFQGMWRNKWANYWCQFPLVKISKSPLTPLISLFEKEHFSIFVYTL